MSQTVLLKRSAIPGKVPTTTDLSLGEVGINSYDGKMYIKQDNGVATIKEVGGDQFPAQTGNGGKFLKTDGTSTFWSASGGTSSHIVQNLHGFSVGNVLRYNGAAYVLASSAVAATSDVVGIVTSIADPNSFELTTSGFITGMTGLTPAASYFLSDTVQGALTPTEPLAVGTISKPLFIATSATTGLFYNWRGIANVTPIEINALLPSQAGHISEVLVTNGTSVGWLSAASAVNGITVSAPGNTLVVGNVCKATGLVGGAAYALAQANNATNAQVFGIITQADANSYTLITSGAISGLSGLTPGALYYLSDSIAGGLTSTEPVSTTSISKPIFIATTSSSGVFFNQRGLPVTVAKATTASLLPTISGATNGMYLTNNGVTSSWAAIVSGVSSFNTRTGAVTLSAADVTSALTYTPVNPTALSAYALLTGATFTGDVTTYRLAAPSTGVLFLGNNGGTRYVYYDGTNYQMPGAALYVNSARVVTGNRTVSTAAPSGTPGVGDMWYQY
jgi:hypothetical protein